MMKQNFLFRNLYIFYSCAFILHIFNVFLQKDFLNYIVGILAIPMLVISFFGATTLFKILGFSFLGIGTFMFLSEGHPISQLPLFFTSSMSLLTLLAVLPWMNSVVRSGRFDQKLRDLMKANVNNLGQLYPRSTATTYTLGAFLNLSAIPISQEVLMNSLTKIKTKVQQSFITTATLRGFSLVIIWSPVEILLALTIQSTQVSYASFLPWLLLLSFIGLLFDLVWGRFYYRKFPYEATGPSHTLNLKELGMKIFHLVTALSLFLIVVIFTGNLLNQDFVIIVTLVILPFSVIWAIVMKRWRSFWSIGWKTWKIKTNSMQNFIVLFLSLAFFTNSLQGTELLQSIQYVFIANADYPIVILLLIQFTFLLLAFFGVHPVATLGILSEVITPLLTFMNPLSVGIALMIGAVINASIGTYGLVVTITSINTKQSPYRISLINLPFALFMIVAGTTLAYLLL
ncbi:hypothetical protein [Anaerobacillus alkalidiazotrophicus]|nr:hypothetical protein [Anaerobacillus alkalidiazotrophicus]